MDTIRWALPTLAAGQAQKEITHNEALAAIDLLIQPTVAAVGIDVPPADPLPGRCWIVGRAPVGAWAGHATMLAGWTPSGWRFAAPREGMCVWSLADRGWARWEDGAWKTMPRGAALTDPAGGATIDAEARATLRAVLTLLRGHGLLIA